MDPFISRLRDHVYVDWAGAALSCDSQTDAICAALKTELIVNPHSRIDDGGVDADARMRVLQLVNADPTQYVLRMHGGGEGVA